MGSAYIKVSKDSWDRYSLCLSWECRESFSCLCSKDEMCVVAVCARLVYSDTIIKVGK